MILVVAMVIVFAIAAMAISLGYTMRAEAGVAANAASARSAQLVERGAEQYVLAALSTTLAADANPQLEALDQSYWQDVSVGDGHFWVVRPDYNDPLLPAFGVVDESGKVDLNTADFPRLMKLPGMTDQLAAGIIDWRDADDDVTEGVGAESSTYEGQTPPHPAKNAPFENVEELLMVNGMTPELLYGPSGQPPLGISGGDGGGTFATELWQRRGLFDLFTVWSAVPRLAPDGTERISTGGEDLGPLREKVDAILGDGKGQAVRRARDNVFLIAQDAGWTEDELRRMEPYLVNGDASKLSGRINVNFAPREVLLTADEDATDGQADAIVTARRSRTAEYPGSMAWLLTAAPDALEQFDDDVTARGAFFSADVVAVGGDGRAFRRARIVVDASDASNPQIVYRRDITERGWPLDPQILANLRGGGAGGAGGAAGGN